MKFPCLFAILLFVGNAFGESETLDRQLLRTVLQPWVSANLPKFRYVGPDTTSDRPFSWSFVHSDDPHLKTTFPLDVQMEFCLTEAIAHSYMHANDWSLVGVPNTGTVPSHIGDESDVFDIRKTYSGRDPGSMGGWVYCRVGTCLFFIRSYSVTLEAMKDLATKIAAAIPHLPEPPRKVRTLGEASFRQAIAESKKQEEEFKKIPPQDRLPYPLGGAPPNEQKP